MVSCLLLRSNAVHLLRVLLLTIDRSDLFAVRVELRRGACTDLLGLLNACEGASERRGAGRLDGQTAMHL